MESRGRVAMRGLLAQLAAAALVFGLAALPYPGLPDWALTVWSIAGLQGVLAGAIGAMLGAAWWWFPIHLLFLPTLLLVERIQLSPAFFLAGFFILLAFNWGVIRSRVPLYLSRRSAWRQVESLLPADRTYRLLDIGSGLGGMLLHLDQARPMGVHEGIEISPASWLVSRVRARLAGARARFRRGDYRQIDLSAYDVVFAFLSPVVMDELRLKAVREMRPGALLLSLSFPLPDVEPDLVLPTGGAQRQVLYGWRMSAGNLAASTDTARRLACHQPA